MKNKLLFTLVIMSFVLIGAGLAEAQITPTDIFRQDSVVDFKFSCDDENTGLPCDTTYSCNMTITYPNSSFLINNQPTSRVGDATLYNISLPDTSVLGFYKYEPFCTNGTNSGTSDDLNYQITPTGFVLSTSQGIIYLFILLLSGGFFGLSLFGAIVIPWTNTIQDGKIIGVNMLKYGKMSLWFVSYIFLIWMAWLAWNISFGFLNFDVASNFFEVIFKILLALTFPVITIFFVALIVNFLYDKKLREALERGFQLNS